MSAAPDNEPLSQERPRHSPVPPLPRNEQPLYLVMNASSGRQDTGAARDAIVQELEKANRQYRVFIARKPIDVERLSHRAVDAAVQASGCVVAVGGDGTINTVANHAYRADCNFAIIPLGTFNYAARSHGIPENPREAALSLLNSDVREVQVGMVNERLFLVNAGLGFYPHVLRQREHHKAQLGRSRGVALFSALVSLADLPAYLTLDITHDDVTESKLVSTLFVGNNVLQLQHAGLMEADSLSPGTLLAATLDPVTPMQMFGLGIRAAIGNVQDNPHVNSFPFAQMTVTRRGKRRHRQLRVAVDGEVTSMLSPITFRVAPRPLMLMVPRPEG